jgi:lipopolysaccharide transport system ATP-binding protein
MAPPSVTVENLSKRYRIGGAARTDYGTIRDRIASAFRPRQDGTGSREVWALRDINLVIEEGEAFGVIGHNGAGKSTLLKILSRITEPSEGRAVLNGRVASLLEVGTGFHPELTGRENIFLNGAILGMTRAEIRRDFDAIVAFAEVERFLDTPVKRYSSGMYVRLAFAVAAHLTPEILLVDEVLAVGDIEFQRRCLGRMNEVARSGRTVFFVSHNLASIEALCPRSVLLSSGGVTALGSTPEVIGAYTARRAHSMVDLRALTDREGSGRARVTAIEILTADSTDTADAVAFRQPFRVRVHYDASQPLAGAAVGFGLLTEKNERVFISESTDRGVSFDLAAGTGTIDCLVQDPNVLPGTYRLEVWLSEVPGVLFADHVRMIGALEIVPGAPNGPTVSSLTARGRGHVYIDSEWQRA